MPLPHEAGPIRLPPKVVLYVTSGQRLLVIREPAFPEAGLQPPGGTIEPGEGVEAAAIRELEEETGLTAPARQLVFLGTETLMLERDGKQCTLERHYVHIPVTGPHEERWTWWEATPSSGGPPILFELFWHPLDAPIDLGYGRDAFLHALRSRLKAPTGTTTE